MSKFLCVYEIYAGEEPRLSHDTATIYTPGDRDQIRDIDLGKQEEALLISHEETGWSDITDVIITSIVKLREDLGGASQ